MRGKIFLVGLILAFSGAVALAQENHSASSITQDDIYCSGVITSEAVPHDTILITGEESEYKVTFQEGNFIYINKGSSQGVKVGDVFSAIRSVQETIDIEWAKWQFSILRKLGTVWQDEGRVRVVSVNADTSVAQVEHSCEYLQRGDILLPFQERPAPPRKSEANFDRFAPPSGKATAMVVAGKRFGVEYGANDIVYVNLGNAQGVKVGDYFRIFRYNGTEHETAYQTRRFAFDADSNQGIFGFGSVPLKYKWNNVPRQVLGEGVVVRTGTNSSTVLVTFSLRELFAGDYVELE